MTVGNENKDIHVVTKGIAVVEIGDSLVNVNGLFTINNTPIFESGSNANGKYVKFADGTMVCYGQFEVLGSSYAYGALYRTNFNSPVTFPVEFTLPPQISITTTNVVGIIGEAEILTTGIDYLVVLRADSYNYTFNIDYIAIGKWK